MLDVLATNAPTGWGQVISQVISGAILLVLAFVAKYIRSLLGAIAKLTDSQSDMTAAFTKHVAEDAKQFKKFTKMVRQIRQSARTTEAKVTSGG